jgi:hypothetical protein
MENALAKMFASGLKLHVFFLSKILYLIQDHHGSMRARTLAHVHTRNLIYTLAIHARRLGYPEGALQSESNVKNREEPRP